MEGVIEGEGSKEVRVCFSPDHQSSAYTDKVIVELNEKVSHDSNGSGTQDQ